MNRKTRLLFFYIASVAENSGAVLRKNSINSTTNGSQQSRPLSEVLTPPTFIKFNASQPLTLPKLPDDESLHEPAAQKQVEYPITQTVDVPSLEFESALEISSISSQNTKTSINSESSTYCCRSDSPGNDTLNVEQPPGTETISNTKKLFGKQQRLYRGAETVHRNENIYEFESDEQLQLDGKQQRQERSNAISTDSVIDVSASPATAKEPLESKIDSENSSALDAGFYSFGEAENSQASVDAATSSSDQEDSMIRNSEKTGSPGQMRKGVPIQLRACYVNPYNLHSDQRNSQDLTIFSKSSNSSTSATLSEDEAGSDILNFENRTFCDKSDTSSFGALTKNENLNAPVHTASAQLKLKVRERPNETKKSFRSPRDKQSQQPPSVAVDDSKSPVKNNKSVKTWKDDLDASTAKSASGPVVKPVRSHGTWPRQTDRSKRKRNQVEADELLQKFREMSEIYRARFRKIYEETRRRIEETMFGLRVAVAKSGYSSKYYSLSGSTKKS